MVYCHGVHAGLHYLQSCTATSQMLLCFGELAAHLQDFACSLILPYWSADYYELICGPSSCKCCEALIIAVLQHWLHFFQIRQKSGSGKNPTRAGYSFAGFEKLILPRQ